METVRPRVSMIHPQNRFLDVHAASPFFSFFHDFGSFRVDLLGVLGLRTLSIA